MYIASLLLLLLLFQPRTPLLQSKLPPPFQTVSNNEGLCSFFPLKRTKETEKSGKLINLDPHLCQHLITCSLGTNNQKTYWSTKNIHATKIKMKKNSCTPINPKKYSCYGLKKIQARNLLTNKNFMRLKNPPPPPITFLKVRPLSIHLLCLFLFHFSNGLSRVQPNSQLFSTQLCCKSGAPNEDIAQNH